MMKTKYLSAIIWAAAIYIGACALSGCIGPQWDEYEAKVDQLLEDYKGGVITHDEFNDLREQAAEDFRADAKEEIAAQTRGPITGNPLLDSLIGAAGLALGSVYGLNRHRNKTRAVVMKEARQDPGEAV